MLHAAKQHCTCDEDHIPQGYGYGIILFERAHISHTSRKSDSCLYCEKMYKHLTFILRGLSFVIWSSSHFVEGSIKF